MSTLVSDLEQIDEQLAGLQKRFSELAYDLRVGVEDIEKALAELRVPADA